MKKFAKFSFLVLIPIVTGVVCFIVGSNPYNNTVIYAGMLALVAGVPATMVILLVVGLILMSMGKLGDGEESKSDTTSTAGKDDDSRQQECERAQDDSPAPSDEAIAADNKTTVTDGARGVAAEEEALSQRERERNMINAVNGANGFESRVNMADYEIRHVAEGMKNAPKWGIVVGLTGFFLLVADLVVATILLIKGIYVGAIVCAALLGVTIITALIATAISRAKAMNDDIRKARKITEGKVKTCFMVGATATKTGGNRYQSSNGQTVRIKDVTYRVIVSADGIEYGAFSKRFYETDEIVTIAVMGKNRAKIVADAEPEKIISE